MLNILTIFSPETVASNPYPVQIVVKYSILPDTASLTFLSGTNFSDKFNLNYTKRRCEVMIITEFSFS